MARFAAFLMLGPKGALSERYLGEVEAASAASALILAKSVFAYGQPFSRSRIMVRSQIVDVQPAAHPGRVQSFAGAGLFLAVAIISVIVIGNF